MTQIMEKLRIFKFFLHFQTVFCTFFELLLEKKGFKTQQRLIRLSPISSFEDITAFFVRIGVETAKIHETTKKNVV